MQKQINLRKDNAEIFKMVCVCVGMWGGGCGCGCACAPGHVHSITQTAPCVEVREQL